MTIGMSKETNWCEISLFGLGDPASNYTHGLNGVRYQPATRSGYGGERWTKVDCIHRHCNGQKRFARIIRNFDNG